MPTPIPNPEARAIITIPPQMQAREKNQRQRQWQLQPQAASTPQSVVSSSCCIHRFGHSDMTHPGLAMGRLLKLYMWHRLPFMSASDIETVSYATQHVAKPSAESPHW